MEFIQKCVITNGHFTWKLEVDGHEIHFQNRQAAIYFALHYTGLGYELVFKKHCESDIPLSSEEIEKHLDRKEKKNA